MFVHRTVQDGQGEEKALKIEDLYAKARALPATPGVYIMRNSSGTVIYVGKSKALRNRVGSYFAPYGKHYGKTLRMINSVNDFEVYHTATELEALVLENQFIKQFMPKYNIKLKDSSGYPYIKLSEGDYPRLSVVNKREGEGRYFGPFASHGTAKDILDTAIKAFGLPTCGRKFPEDIGKGRPCLNYQIKQCSGLCTGKISKADYAESVAGVVKLLGGDYGFLEKELEAKMNSAAEKMDFERAAKYRDSMRAVKKIGDKQHIIASVDTEADVFGIYTDELGSAVTVLFVRNGALVDKESFFFGAEEIISDATLASFLQRFYEIRDFIPKQVWLDFDIGEEAEPVAEWLRNRTDCVIKLLSPKRGDKKALCSQASNNAKELCLHRRAEFERQNDLLVSIAKFLNVEVVPERIEVYDISNSGDEHITAGMIVVEDGRFCKRKYRSFNIKSTEAQDDYGALREALSRRFAHIPEGDAWAAPDLILVDGGEIHVACAKSAVADAGLYIPVFGMVKDEHHKTRTLTDGENELSLIRRQDLFVFFYKLQEEVHRFALSRMDVRRRKVVKQSVLQEVKGVGEKKALEILRHFGGLAELKAASVDEIEQVKGINRETAQAIFDYLLSLSN